MGWSVRESAAGQVVAGRSGPETQQGSPCRAARRPEPQSGANYRRDPMPRPGSSKWRAAIARSRARCHVGARAVRCPIFRPGRGDRLAVQVKLDVRASPSAAAQFGSPSAQRSPSRFAIAAGCSISGDPSGRPQMARSCCSNWLVRQASNVRCPELCGRGASSLTSKPAVARRRRTRRRECRCSRAPPSPVA